MSSAHDDRPAARVAAGIDPATLTTLRRVADAVLALTHTSPSDAIDRAEADFAMQVRADRLIRLLDEVEALRAARCGDAGVSAPLKPGARQPH